MKEITKGLFIGNDKDWEKVKEHSSMYEYAWAVVHACKEPYHRQLLGYTSRGAPKEHPEYLYAERGDILYLNLVDAHKAEYISSVIICKTLNFIRQKLEEGRRVLVHCNKGGSRSAVIGMIYLACKGFYNGMEFEQAEEAYKLVYPYYNPGKGMREYLKNNWGEYSTTEKEKKA